MNEASSKFVDQLVLDKLLSEKLQKVHHYPEDGVDFQEPLFQDWEQFRDHAELKRDPVSEQMFSFRSWIDVEDDENQQCPVRVFEVPQAQYSLVLHHGLFEENHEIYDFLFRNLNQLGMNVYQCTLPFHYERKPQKALFSGEYFWSANFGRTRQAFRQGVYDLYALYRHIQKQNQHPVLLGGFSMGGALALMLSALCDDLLGVVAINPAVSLSGIVWDSPLCVTIKNDFLSRGYSLQQLQAAFAHFEPAHISRRACSADQMMICYGIYDQVTSPSQYEYLISSWGIRCSHAYKSGHLNTLRVPRMAQDIYNFCQRL